MDHLMNCALFYPLRQSNAIVWDSQFSSVTPPLPVDSTQTTDPTS